MLMFFLQENVSFYFINAVVMCIESRIKKECRFLFLIIINDLCLCSRVKKGHQIYIHTL